MKKIVCILCAVMVAGMMTSSPCLALENSISDASSTNHVLPYNLTIWGTKAICYKNNSKVSGSVVASYEPNYTAQMSVTVQRSTDEIHWTNAGSLGTVTGSNGKLTLSDDYPAQSGYYYQLKATVTVYNGGTVAESITFYSNVV